MIFEENVMKVTFPAALLLALPLLSQRIDSERIDLGRIEPDFAIAGMTLHLRPSAARQAALDKLLDDQQDLASAQYHRWLTPEQFAERFGASPGDVAKLTAWLQGRGLQVGHVARSRNWIVFSGQARQVENAFQTEIHRYRADGAARYANVARASIPADIAGLVTGVDGLDDFPPESGTRRPEMTSAGGTHTLAPDDWATIYNVTPLYQAGIDGTGQKIAIAGNAAFTTSLNDVATFRSTFGLPANTTQVVKDPNYTLSTTEDSGEGHLDVEWSGAIARKATIIYVQSNTFFHAVQYAIENNLANVLSVSANSGCESQTGLDVHFYRLLAQQANAQGITWLNSATDAGAAGCDANGSSTVAGGAVGGLAVRFPSSIPEVTGVGGTEFNEGSGTYWNATNFGGGGSALSYIPEMVWNDSVADRALWAGGGGVSLLFAKPAWQVAPGVPADGQRDLPDISFAASFNHDGYYVFRNGIVVTTGGTSASAPTFAGLVALLNQYMTANGLGNINPALYRLARTNPEVFHDITVGNNIVACTTGSLNCVNGGFGFSASSGYDLASGLGSVDAAKFFAQWAASTPQLSMGATVNGASFAAGAPVAPGSIVSIFGGNLASAIDTAASVPLASILVDAQVTVAGRSAPLFYVSMGQLNLQLPFETPLGAQPMTVTTAGSKSNSINVQVAATAPGIFLYQGMHAVAQHADYTLIGPSSPASAGETVIVYATGQGASLTVPVATGAAAPASPTAQLSPGVSVSATVGGKNAPVAYTGLTAGLVGLLQVNVQMPAGLAAGDYPLVITIGGVSSNAAQISLRN